MPESPRWLMMHNYSGDALSIIMRMHGTSDTQNEEVQTEVTLINQAIELEELGGATGWLDLFKMNDSQNLRRVMLGWWLMAMVMLSGVCSIGYYISYLFETSVGLSHNLSLLLSGFNGLCMRHRIAICLNKPRTDNQQGTSHPPSCHSSSSATSASDGVSWSEPSAWAAVSSPWHLPSATEDSRPRFYASSLSSCTIRSLPLAGLQSHGFTAQRSCLYICAARALPLRHLPTG